MPFYQMCVFVVDFIVKQMKMEIDRLLEIISMAISRNDS